MKKYPMKAVTRDLETLVNMGLVKKTVRNGVELYSATFGKRIKELIKQGVEIHEAYYRAIAEQAPNIDQQSLIKLVAELVHGNKGQNDSKLSRKTFINRVPAA